MLTWMPACAGMTGAVVTQTQMLLPACRHLREGGDPRKVADRTRQSI
jgi:hypothetical protein